MSEALPFVMSGACGALIYAFGDWILNRRWR